MTVFLCGLFFTITSVSKEQSANQFTVAEQYLTRGRMAAVVGGMISGGPELNLLGRFATRMETLAGLSQEDLEVLTPVDRSLLNHPMPLHDDYSARCDAEAK